MAEIQYGGQNKGFLVKHARILAQLTLKSGYNKVFGVRETKFNIFDFIRKTSMAEIQYGGQNGAQIRDLS